MDEESANQPSARQKCLSNQTHAILIFTCWSTALSCLYLMSLFSFPSPPLHPFVTSLGEICRRTPALMMPVIFVLLPRRHNDLLSFRLSAACSPITAGLPLTRMRNCGGKNVGQVMFFLRMLCLPVRAYGSPNEGPSSLSF